MSDELNSIGIMTFMIFTLQIRYTVLINKRNCKHLKDIFLTPCP